MRRQDPVTAKLGGSLPPNDDHAVSVSLPKWKDTVGWANRDPQVLAQLRLGYPRFFIHRIIENLAGVLLGWLTQSHVYDDRSGHVLGELKGPGPRVMLFPLVGLGWSCVEYLRTVREAGVPSGETILAFAVDMSGSISPVGSGSASSSPVSFRNICVVVYPGNLFKEAKAFWQHTGFGISSRQAAFWLDNLTKPRDSVDLDGQSASLPQIAAAQAAHKIKRRISGLFSSQRDDVTHKDVFLYPAGMSAIARSATALMKLYRATADDFRVAIFGFLYVDTFKVLSKVKKIDCVLYGHASCSDLDQLEEDLMGGMRIHALYTEFPGNPLLGSIDLARLRLLSNRHDFHVVVDDTVGTAVNLDISSSCDLICTSLTKMFSGACNVMGGSVTVCPQAKDREGLRRILADQHVDAYFPHDLLMMEGNSRDFIARVIAANKNAEAVVNRIRGHTAVDQVFYPKGGKTQHLYDQYKRATVVDEDGQEHEAGYGYLLSIRFVKPCAAIAFHDALELAKGPSLGTNFTLTCAYTLLAHASELEWAAKFGVVEHLVRVSVGIEDRQCLEDRIDVALDAAARSLVPDL